MRQQIKRLVASLTVLAIWVVPSVEGMAADLTNAPEIAAPVEPASAPVAPSANYVEVAPSPEMTAAMELAAAYENREMRSPELQDFRGGGVSIYVGSGALLVVIILLLVILL